MSGTETLEPRLLGSSITAVSIAMADGVHGTDT